MCEVINTEEFIIKYPKKDLENVLEDLKKLGFFENADKRIELENKYITKIEYRGKEDAKVVLEKNNINYETIDDVYIL